jgi:hypothetical protein
MLYNTQIDEFKQKKGTLMKKKLFIITCLATTYAQAMEIVINNKTHKNKTYSWNTQLGNTTINVTKGPMSSINKKVDIMVVGRNQQRQLQEPSFGDSHNIGTFYYTSNSAILYEKNKENESASDDDSYHPYLGSSKSDAWQRAQTTTINCPVITIIEPRITLKQSYKYENEKRISMNVPEYYFRKEIQGHKDGGICENHQGETAISKASEDLKQCYETSLTTGLELLKNNKSGSKSIALQALSTEVGLSREKAAPIATSTIISFLDKHPNTYNRIELFVKKRSEFKQYKALLTELITVDNKQQ